MTLARCNASVLGSAALPGSLGAASSVSLAEVRRIRLWATLSNTASSAGLAWLRPASKLKSRGTSMARLPSLRSPMRTGVPRNQSCSHCCSMANASAACVRALGPGDAGAGVGGAVDAVGAADRCGATLLQPAKVSARPSIKPSSRPAIDKVASRRLETDALLRTHARVRQDFGAARTPDICRGAGPRAACRRKAALRPSSSSSQSQRGRRQLEQRWPWLKNVGACDRRNILDGWAHG